MIKGCTLYDSFTLEAGTTEYKYSVGDFGLVQNDPFVSQYLYCYKILVVLEDHEAEPEDERHFAICQFFRHSRDSMVPENKRNCNQEVSYLRLF